MPLYSRTNASSNTRISLSIPPSFPSNSAPGSRIFSKRARPSSENCHPSPCLTAFKNISGDGFPRPIISSSPHTTRLLNGSNKSGFAPDLISTAFYESPRKKKTCVQLCRRLPVATLLVSRFLTYTNWNVVL